jgi:putative redox protein
MQITVSHLEGKKFEAKTPNSSFIIDCPVISPIEYFLAGLIACSTTDVQFIPANQGKTVKNLRVTGDVVRNEDMPRKFNTLHLTYDFESDGDDIEAARWVMASIETYCSTINTVRDSVKISYTIIHNGKTIKENEEVISGQGGNYDLGTLDACCPS